MINLYFSVVIPSFNRLSYLKKSVDSVLCQSYKMFEIIVIDNNSSDGSQDYIESLNNSKIKLLSTNNFGSIAKSRNIGIENAKGNWISFLDSDDYWHPDKLKYVSEKILEEKLDMVSHDKYIIDLEDKILIDKKLNFKKIKGDTLKYLISKKNLYSTSTISVSKEFIKNNKLFFDERLILSTVEDYDLWIRLTINKIKVGHINLRLGYYRIHNNNASKNHLKQIEAGLFVKKKNLKYVMENQLFNFKDLLEIILNYYIYFFYVKIKKISSIFLEIYKNSII